MNLTNLKDMIDRAMGVTAAEPSAPDEDTPVVRLNRSDKRMRVRSHYKASAERRANRPRHKTGQPAWFRGMKVRAAVKAQLEKVPTVHLFAGPHDGEPARELAALSDAGFNTIWKLSQADRTDLLAVKGIGPAKLRQIRLALVQRSVPVAWKAE